MPRKKKSKLPRILDAIEKTLVKQANETIRETTKKKSSKTNVKKQRPIDF